MPAAKVSQKVYWDSVAPVKTFTLEPDFALIEKFIGRESFVLDYGCGYGRTLDKFYRAGYKNTLGLDFSEGMIRRGKMLFPHLQLKKTGGRHTNLPGASVDMVLLFALLTCVVEDKEQQELMTEFKRILKPGGLLYVKDFLLNEDERNQKRYLAFEEKYGIYGVFELPEGAVLRHYAEKHVKELMKGFRMLYFETTRNKTMNGNYSKGFTLVAEKL